VHEKAEGPTREKAQKTYKDALKELHERHPDMVLENFKKADKQDGGHCPACQKQMIQHSCSANSRQPTTVDCPLVQVGISRKH
jgi:hypothetical protein